RSRQCSLGRGRRDDLEAALGQQPCKPQESQLRASEHGSLGNGQDPRCGGHAGIMSGVTRFDDEIWEAVPEDAGPPPGHLVSFVETLSPADEALELGRGDGQLTLEIAATRL